MTNRKREPLVETIASIRVTKRLKDALEDRAELEDRPVVNLIRRILIQELLNKGNENDK